HPDIPPQDWEDLLVGAAAQQLTRDRSWLRRRWPDFPRWVKDRHDFTSDLSTTLFEALLNAEQVEALLQLDSDYLAGFVHFRLTNKNLELSRDIGSLVSRKCPVAWRLAALVAGALPRNTDPEIRPSVDGLCRQVLRILHEHGFEKPWKEQVRAYL